MSRFLEFIRRPLPGQRQIKALIDRIGTKLNSTEPWGFEKWYREEQDRKRRQGQNV
jgi:hypothetical protein